MNLKSLFLFLLIFLIIKEAAAQKYDAEVVKYSTFCDVETNKLTRTDSVTIRINDREGDKYTEISIPYSKTEKVSDLDAWIMDMNGATVRKLKNSEIVDKSAISDISLYEDNYQKCFQLKHNVYPYKVVYTYKTTFIDYLTVAWWRPIIYREIPTYKARLTVKMPKNFQFKQYAYNIQEAKADITGSGTLLEWESSYNKPIKREIFSRPDIGDPFVVITPLSFKYGPEGSMETWGSYGNWQYRLIQGLDVLSEKERTKVSELIKGINDNKETIKVLYHYLQDHTHYINVSIGIGGMKPYPASYVSENRYGDCKALTNYMKALLKHAGIESYYAHVEGSEQPGKLLDNFPGPQFNHAVLAVPIGHDTIWLDNTSNTLPFGYMGTFTQNRKALLISENSSRLVRIPALKKEDNHVAYKLEFELNTNGQAKVTLNNSFKGRDFELFNNLQTDFNESEKDKNIREYMPFDNYEVVRWELKKLHRDTARIELNAVLNLYKLLKPLGNEYYFSLYPVRIPLFQPIADRELPVALPYPLSVTDTLIYNLPAGYGLKAKFDPVAVKSRFGSYEVNLTVQNGRICAIKRFDLFPGTYSLEQYPEFYSFIQSVKEKEKVNLIIKPIN